MKWSLQTVYSKLKFLHDYKRELHPVPKYILHNSFELEVKSQPISGILALTRILTTESLSVFQAFGIFISSNSAQQRLTMVFLKQLSTGTWMSLS